MAEQDSNKSTSSSPETPKQKQGKSVRWTGQDYFSYSGGSGNRAGHPPERAHAPEEPHASEHNDTGSSDSSSTDSDSSDEDNDEQSADVRAATRANTWFNRLRQEDDDDDGFQQSRNPGRKYYNDHGDSSDNSDDEHSALNRPSSSRSSSRPASGPSSRPSSRSSSGPSSSRPSSGPSSSASSTNAGAHPRESSTSPPSIPSIQVSEHPDINPYSHIMDIGTEVSGGLAPGSRENVDHDPNDKEYRERRNRLLASLGSHSQPSSPQLGAVDPLDDGDIPLQNLAPTRRTTTRPAMQQSPQGDEQNRRGSSTAQPAQPAQSSDPDQGEQQERREAAEAAETLRRKLESKQRERVQRMEKVIAARKRHERNPSSTSSHSNISHRDDTDSDSSSDSGESEQTKTKEEEQEEELKRLEEAARQEAEEHAKHLVKAHLAASNILKPNSRNDGYVDNHNYLLDAGLLDDDIPMEEEPNDENNDKNDKNGGKGNQNDAESDRKDNNTKKEGGSTSSSETLQNPNEKTQDRGDNSDSDSESEEERPDVSLRGDPDYVPPPKKVKEGVLGSLLRLYAGQEDIDDSKSTNSTSAATSPSTSPSVTPSSTPLGSPSLTTPGGTPSEYPNDDGTTTSGTEAGGGHKRWKRPGYFHTHSSEDVLGRENKGRPKWYKRASSSHTPSLSQLASSGLSVAGGAASNVASAAAHHANPHGFSKRMGRSTQSVANDIADVASKFERRGHDDLSTLRDKEAKKRAKKEQQAEREKKKALKKARLAEQTRITVHIADVLQRQRFLLRLGRALMLFGAPSHRLEEYLRSTARVLEIDAQVLYIPGCILVSFGDATTHTSETKLIRVTQGLNLLKLHGTHIIYKEVLHDLMSLEEASSHIDHLLRSKNIYPWWLVVLFYGTACVCCGMFAYGAWWRDIPIIFFLGGGVGFLQFWVQPKSDLYANVFEVSSSIFVSFIGRAFGSIGNQKDYVFCFAAIVQASLALILPGYIILVGALELQTKNLVAGSVRMFYANIYSLFLSFGITLGSAIFGWIYRGAVTDTTCQHNLDPKWKILFVPLAGMFMALVNQAGPRQLPIMVVIGSAGYAVQYFVDRSVKAAAFTSAIGAFTMGVMGNLYSRVGHGLAFAAMLPGIFILVPSGVAAQGSLVAGVKVATEIVNASKYHGGADNSSQTISDLGNTMTQVAVGIVVGLFAATLVVYPLGFKKKRSGLFTF